MFLRRPVLTSAADCKDHSGVSTPASLASLSNNGSVETLDMDLDDNKADTTATARSPDDPPSYADATSDRSSATASHVVSPEGADEVDTPMPRVKTVFGDMSFHSSETLTGPVVITGMLNVYSKVRFIGSLEVQNRVTVHNQLTVDGALRVAGDLHNYGTLTVAEAAELDGKLSNHGRATFAKAVVQRGKVSNYGTLKYNERVDLCLCAVDNHGTIDAPHGADNLGKVSNYGKSKGFNSI